MIRRQVIKQAEESEELAFANLTIGTRLNATQLWGGILASALLLVQHTQQVQN